MCRTVVSSAVARIACPSRMQLDATRVHWRCRMNALHFLLADCTSLAAYEFGLKTLRHVLISGVSIKRAPTNLKKTARRLRSSGAHHEIAAKTALPRAIEQI